VITGIHAKPVGTILTTTSVMEEFGGSPGTIRTLLERLANDGALINKGPDPDHHGKASVGLQALSNPPETFGRIAAPAGSSSRWLGALECALFGGVQ
jgi:hypothetical protein